MEADFELGFEAFIVGPNSESHSYPGAHTFSPNTVKSGQTQWPNNNELGSVYLAEGLPLGAYSGGFSDGNGGQIPFNRTDSYYTNTTGNDSSDVYMEADGDVKLDQAIDLDSGDQASLPRRNTESSVASPAQSRRKAQNRAAQRAFRERKERHVRELEAQLSALTEKATSLQCDNDRLVSLIRKVQHENRFLRTRQSKRQRSPSLTEANGLLGDKPSDGAFPPSTDSSRASPTTQSITEPTTPNSPFTLTNNATKCLDPAATWDLLVSHPLFLKGVVDISQVCEKLGMLARCEDTAGPYFDESDVRRVIEEAANDESSFN